MFNLRVNRVIVGYPKYAALDELSPSEVSKILLLKSPRLVLEYGTPGRNLGVGAHGR